MPTLKTKTPTREHASEDPKLYRQIRRLCVEHGNPLQAVLAATQAGYRVEQADLFLPHLAALAMLANDEERRLYRRRFRAEIDGEEKAVAKIEWLINHGYNMRTRASEIAAKQEQTRNDAAARIARVDAMAQRLQTEHEMAIAAELRAKAARLVGGAA